MVRPRLERRLERQHLAAPAIFAAQAIVAARAIVAAQAIIAALAIVVSCAPGARGPSPMTTQTGPGLTQPGELGAGSDPFARLPPPSLPQEQASLSVAPQLPQGPPPAPGAIELPFPPPAPPPKPGNAAVPPLRVLRVQPRGQAAEGPDAQDPGEAGTVGAVVVSFNQPMVPLGAVGELPRGAAEVPLRLKPLPPGRFRWIDPSTLSFEPEGRLPFATEYSAEVPAGVHSQLGAALATPERWSFRTPAPKLVRSVPDNGAEGIDPKAPLLLVFNARIDSAAVAHAARLVEEPNGASIALTAAALTAATATTALGGQQLSAQELPRAALLRPARALAPAHLYSLALDPGLKSTEGPLPLGVQKALRFTTYGPLELLDLTCGWGGKECQPGSPLQLRFNNFLHEGDLRPFLKLSPAPKDLVVNHWGNTVSLEGSFAPSTDLQVTVSADLRDVHKQRLGHTETRHLRIGPLEPGLELDGHPLASILPGAHPALGVSAVNIPSAQVRVAAVPEARLAAIAQKVAESNGNNAGDADALFAGLEIARSQLSLGAARDRELRGRIELTPALQGGRGVALVEVLVPAPAEKSPLPDVLNGPDRRRGREPQRFLRLVQVTSLGITAAQSDEQIIALVTTLQGGAPRAGVELALIDQQGATGASARTDADGIARLPAPQKLKGVSPWVLLARDGAERAFLYIDGTSTFGSYLSSYRYNQDRGAPPELVGGAWSERGVYRPGEAAHVLVIARQRTRGPAGAVQPLAAGSALAWEAHGSDGAQLGQGTLSLSPFGTASFELPLSKELKLGTVSIELKQDGGPQGSLDTSFEVEEFRAPDLKATVQFEPQKGPLLLGGQTSAEVKGEYRFGAPLAGAHVTWTLLAQEAAFAPPGNEGFHFGGRQRPRPLLRHSIRQPPPAPVGGGEGVLDGAGKLRLPVPLQPCASAAPIVQLGDSGSDAPARRAQSACSFTLEAEVMDAGRQSVAARATALAHPAALYAGLRIARSVLKPGEPVEVDAVVVDPSGARAKAVPIELSLAKQVRKNDATGAVVDSEETAATLALTSADAPAHGQLAPQGPGSYVLRARALDAGNRESRTELELFVSGPAERFADDEHALLELRPDKPDYTPGETARILVQAPFAPARGLLIISREGIAGSRPIELRSAAESVEVALREEWLPGADVTLALVSAEGQPRFAAASVRLPISREPRRLQLSVQPAVPSLKPGGTLEVVVRATRPDGQPAAANLALAVVDEGVLALTGYRTPDALAALTPQPEPETGIKDARPDLIGAPPPPGETDTKGAQDGGPLRPGAQMARSAKMMAPMAAAGLQASGGGAAPSFQVRALFAATAFFDGGLRTGADGTVRVQVKMPDSATEFRVFAVAVDAGKRAGSGEASVRTRQPLLLRAALPRFLNSGDRFSAAATVHNETGAETEVEVLARGVNVLLSSAEPLAGSNVLLSSTQRPDGTGEARARVRLLPGEAREVRFAALAGGPGPAKVQLAAAALNAEQDTDAAEISLPVLVPATAQAFAASGATESSVQLPLLPPRDALPGYGGLQIALSSSALTGLADAVDYLIEYPYACAEQTASRLIALVAIGQFGRDFHIKDIPDEAARAAQLQRAIGRLAQLQQPDGGFRFWEESPRSQAWVSSWATLALELAAAAKVPVEQPLLDRAREYLQHHQLRPPAPPRGTKAPAATPDEPEGWNDEARAQALLVLSRTGNASAPALAQLYAASKQLPRISQAQLLEAAVRIAGPDDSRTAGLLRDLEDAAVETSGAVHFAEGATEAARLLFHSSDRTDAVVLQALLAARPDHPLIDKLVRGLVRSRVRGRWSTTQANAHALLALGGFYQRFEKDVPHFSAGVWLGEKPVAARDFAGREQLTAQSLIPLQLLYEAAAPITVAKTGTGRLYWRLGLRYAPASLRVKAEEQGFALERTYLNEQGRPLPRDPDGAIRIAAGATVRVRVQVIASDRRNFVAVVDPLPAGLEAVNTSFQTSASARLSTPAQDGPDGLGHSRFWYWSPWNHQELRDESVRSFADALPAGVYEFSYPARATTRGRFLVPPSHAEEMYSPDVFGNGATDEVVIE